MRYREIMHTLECPSSQSGTSIQQCHGIINIINWVVQALNADWLTTVVNQTIYHGYDFDFDFFCSNYVGNQFIIVIRHLLGFVVYGQYTTAKACIQALCVALCIRTALSCGKLAIYHNLRALLLK
jgi:hypothetical protein